MRCLQTAPTPGRRHRVGVDMRTILLIGVIGFVFNLTLPAGAHFPIPCKSHLEKLVKLNSEKAEKQKAAIVESIELLERKRDLSLGEISHYIHEDNREAFKLKLRLESLNTQLEEDNLIVQVMDRDIVKEREKLEKQTEELLRRYQGIFLFDSTGPGRTLTAWMNCLTDLREQHSEQAEWPPGYEEMPLLLEDIRAFITK